MASELSAGSAYVELNPSARGWKGKVEKQTAGTAVTQDVTPKVDGAALARARAQMQAAADKVADARRKEADAAGQVRTAEAKLEELRAGAGVKASQIVAAEEKVAAARRKSEAAVAALQKAEATERSATARVERLEIRADTSQADQATEGFVARTKARLTTAGSAVGAFAERWRGAALAVVGAGAAVGYSFVQVAADAEQSLGAVETVFKGSADQVKAWADGAAQNLGLSAHAYREAATLIGSQLKNMGVPMGQVAGQTDTLITKAADLASLFGGTTAEAVEALSSALKGEMDPIERYGISLNQAALDAKIAALGLDTSTDAAQRNAKAVATMALIEEQSADATGNFAREHDTAANAAQRAQAEWDNLRATLGEALLPVMSGVGDVLGSTIIPLIRDNTGLVTGLALVVGGLAAAVLTVNGVMAVASAATKAWSAAQLVLNAVMSANPIMLVVIAVAALVAAVIWAYNKVAWFRDGVQAALSAVGSAATWLWSNVLSPIFALVAAGWSLLLAGFRRAYDAVLAPVFAAFAAVAIWLWSNALSPTFAAARGGWELFAAGFRWAYDNIIRPTFDFFLKAAASFRDGFGRIVDGLKAIWEGIKEAFKAPVRFVLETVWNKGVGWLWDKAKSIGLPIGDFPKVDPLPFAAGGPVGGWSPHRRADNVPAMLTAGEYVHPVDAVGYYGTDVMDALRRRRIPREQLAYLAGGGPVTPQEMYAWVRGKVPTARMTSGLRPGDPGWHGRNRAVDLAGPRPMDTPTMLRINQVIAAHFPGSEELIHTQPGAVNLKRGHPHVYSAAVQAGHHNHVHWANLGSGEGDGKSWLGRAWDTVTGWARAALEGIFDGAVTFARGLVEPIFPRRGSFLTDLPMNMFDWAVEKARGFLFGKADEADAASTSIDPGGAGVERWRPLVLQALARVGEPGSLADTVLRRMNQESGGNPRAINTWDSNARRGTPSKGLMQVIDPTFAANRDPGLVNDIWDPMANVVASMRYAKRRYGSLAAAYNRRGGYDLGGLATGRGFMLKDVIAPERVLSPRQTAAFEDLVPLLDRMSTRAAARTLDYYGRLPEADPGGRGPAVQVEHQHFYDAVDVDEFLDKVEFETRTGRL